MRIVGKYWDNEREEMLDVIVDIERSDDNEVSVQAFHGADSVATLYFTADYEARELVNALNKARADQ